MKIIWVIIIFIVISPPLEMYFQATMSRLMLIQIPLLILLGFIAGKSIKYGKNSWNYLGLNGLIFFMGSLSFWMLPSSFDEIIFNNFIKYAMYIDMIFAGFMLEKSLLHMNFITKISFCSYLLAMLASMGILYFNARFLICGAFTIDQQQILGRNLIIASFILFIFMLYWSVSLLNKNNRTEYLNRSI